MLAVVLLSVIDPSVIGGCPNPTVLLILLEQLLPAKPTHRPLLDPHFLAIVLSLLLHHVLGLQPEPMLGPPDEIVGFVFLVPESIID